LDNDLAAIVLYYLSVMTMGWKDAWRRGAWRRKHTKLELWGGMFTFTHNVMVTHSYVVNVVFPGKTKERRLQNPNQMMFLPQGRQFLLLSINMIIYLRREENDEISQIGRQVI
jgi:hypothetical protein